MGLCINGCKSVCGLGVSQPDRGLLPHVAKSIRETERVQRGGLSHGVDQVDKVPLCNMSQLGWRVWRVGVLVI